jgi:hypothetical protein
MVTEHDSEIQEWPGDADPIATAACPLISAVFELTEHRSRERAAALTEILTAVDRIRAALRPRPSLN